MEIDRDQIIHTTARNLAQAGVVSATELAGAEEYLDTLTYEDLLKALVMSHEMVEEKKQPIMIVDVRVICLN